MRALRNAVIAASLAVAGSSCRTPPTEIVLRVDSDMEQGPGRALTDVRVRIAPAADFEHAVLDRVFPLGVGGYALLPADLGITPLDDDARRSIVVEVTAISSGTQLFTYRAIAGFESQRTNLLAVFLANRCMLQANRDACAEAQTCGRQGCDVVRRDSLPPFVAGASTDAPAIDATSDTLSCSGSATPCGSACVDVSSDPANCGACARTCPMPANGAPTCSAGLCGVACDAHYHTCAGTTQCFPETDVTHCGAACLSCPARAHATPACSALGCGFTCAADFADCNGVESDGCETSLAIVSNCGACGHTCAASMSCVHAGNGYVCSDTCPAGDTCSAGPCAAGHIDCSSGSATCAASAYAAAGSTCPGGVCNASGECVACTQGASCSTGNVCQPGTVDCSTGASRCVARNAPAGSPCSGGVCNAEGSCVPCVSGSSCTPSVDCRAGTVSCSSGAPTCVASGVAPVGTACDGGTCDSSGNCSVCTAGASCDSGNPCFTGTRQCPSGTCSPSGNVAAGTPCGTDRVCDASGSCGACVAHADCSTECAVREIACSTGAPVCTTVMPRPAGTACSGGTCDGSGSCVGACIAGAACGSGSACTTQVIACMPLPVCVTLPDLAGTPCRGRPGVCNGLGMCTL